jgi:hypothetical protein
MPSAASNSGNRLMAETSVAPGRRVDVRPEVSSGGRAEPQGRNGLTLDADPTDALRQ